MNFVFDLDGIKNNFTTPNWHVGCDIIFDDDCFVGLALVYLSVGSFCRPKTYRNPKSLTPQF